MFFETAAQRRPRSKRFPQQVSEHITGRKPMMSDLALLQFRNTRIMGAGAFAELPVPA